MFHWISLIITYLAIAGAYVLIIRLGKKCTTTAPEDSQSKTAPSPTGQTQTISGAIQIMKDMERVKIIRSSMYGLYPEAEIQRAIQEDTEFRSRYRGGLMPLHQPVSGFYSARSTDGGHNDDLS